MVVRCFPALNPVFKTQPLTAIELAISLLLPALVLIAVEIEKIAIRRGWLYRESHTTTPSAESETETQENASRFQNSDAGRSS